jgi:hypothetical protein
MPRSITFSTRLVALVGAFALGLAGCGGGGGSSGSGSAVVVSSVIEVVAGNDQIATAGATLPVPLLVRVTDALGNGVSNVTVTFTVTTGNGSVGTATQTTDIAGEALTLFTLSKTAGTNIVTATASNTTASATFTETGAAGPPSAVALPAGSSTTLSGQVGTPVSLTAVVTDVNGNPVANVAVTFTIASGSGTLSVSSVSTNAQGEAETTLNLPAAAGTVKVTAAVSGVSTGLTFTVTATPPPVFDVTGFSPTTGVTAGTTITITGSGFTGLTKVTIDGAPVTSFTLVSNTEVLATVSSTALTGTVSVTTPQGTATSTGSLTVGPTVRAVSPASAPPGAQVLVTGTGFPNGATVSFGGTAASVVYVTTTALLVTVPTGAALPVTVTTAGGNANAPSFTVLSLPVVTNLALDAATAPVGSGQVLLTYTLSQAQSRPSSVTVQFDASGNNFSGAGPFPVCTQCGAKPGAAPFGVSNLPTSAAGINYELAWNSNADISTQTITNVAVRVTPVLDGRSGTQASLTGITIGNGFSTVAAAAPPGVGNSPNSVAIGDVNKDGIPDLVVANAGDNTVSVLLGNGDGTFTAAAHSPFGATSGVGNVPVSVAIGDVNRDGNPDLVVANNSDGTVSVLFGDGAGNFTADSNGPFSVGTPPQCVALADMNLDGCLDLVTANYNATGNVALLLGDGTGHFAGAPNSPFQGGGILQPSYLAIGDLNRDGKPDVVVANGSNSLTVLLGDGAGNLTPTSASPISISIAPSWVAIGDLNRDGSPDVVAVGGSNLDVLLGDGTGNLTAAPNSPVSLAFIGNSVAIGDLNGDGIPDLAVAIGTPITPGSSAISFFFGNGDGTFTASSLAPSVGSGPVDVALADLTGDGALDVVTVNEADSDLTVLLNAQSPRCNPGLAAPTASPTGNQPHVLACADLNQDGKPDFVVANASDGTVSVLLGQGDGTFVPAATPAVTVGSNPVCVAVGIFASSGIPDLVVANAGGTTLSLLLGNGDGTFTASSLTVGNGPSCVAVGDVNGDGNADLVVANESDGTVSVLLGNGSGGFTAASQNTILVGSNPSWVAIGDLNLDGIPDVAVARASGEPTILLGNGNGTFTFAANPTSGANATEVAIGDLTGSGIPDLVLLCGSQLAVLLGNGDGTFTTGTAPGAVASPSSFALADVSSDGKLDLVVTSSTGNTASVLLGNGNGTFQSPVAYTVGQGAAFVAAADLNGDGKLDLLVSNATDGTVSAVLGNGDGTFRTAPSFALPGDGPNAVAVGDVNRDGKLDVAVPLEAVSETAILLGNGDGTFAQASGSPFATGGAEPIAAAIADVNSDGKLDLVVANHTGDSVSVFLGNGDGTFTQASGSPITVGHGPSAVAIADVNRDGIPDLVVANETDGTVSVLLGVTGTGTFAAAASSPISLTAGLQPTGIAIADVNAHGKLDLAVSCANATGTNVVVLLGDGTGNFPTLESSLSVTGGANAIAAGDLSGDGIIDLVVACAAPSAVSFHGNGDGTFHAGVTYALAGAPTSVALGDVGGDGIPDIVCACGGNDTVVVLPGLGDGTFGAPVSYGGVSSPSAVALADMNRDGKLDIVLVNGTQSGSQGSISVLLGK